MLFTSALDPSIEIPAICCKDIKSKLLFVGEASLSLDILTREPFEFTMENFCSRGGRLAPNPTFVQGLIDLKLSVAYMERHDDCRMSLVVLGSDELTPDILCLESKDCISKVYRGQDVSLVWGFS